MTTHARYWIVLFLAMILCLFSSSALAQDADGDGVADTVDVCCNTPLGVAVNAEGRPWGDLDEDCDTDLVDYWLFQTGFSGPLDPCTPEVCDGFDNDCNCLVDDLGTLTCGTGECLETVPVCSNGIPLSCVPGTPQSESCDGLDNDCDGVIDNGNPGGGGACSTGQVGVCAAGTLVCQTGALTCLPNQGPTTEVCDGVDNNCDGSVDESDPNVGAACNTGFPGVCAAGTLVCMNGALACQQDVPASSEVCDGQDNNCDGTVDEGC